MSKFGTFYCDYGIVCNRTGDYKKVLKEKVK